MIFKLLIPIFSTKFIHHTKKRVYLHVCSNVLIVFFLELSSTQRNLAKTLRDFKFETIGSTQTDDERVIGE